VFEPRGGRWRGWSSGGQRRAGHWRPGDDPNAHAVPHDRAEGCNDKRPAFSTSIGPYTKCRPVHVHFTANNMFHESIKLLLHTHSHTTHIMCPMSHRITVKALIIIIIIMIIIIIIIIIKFLMRERIYSSSSFPSVIQQQASKDGAG